MGGECLNVGCVPSKALIACARRAHQVRSAARFGVEAREPTVDFAAVMAHVEGAIAAIAPHDSEARFEGWGVEVVRGRARFTGRKRLDVDGRAFSAPRIVLATGSRPRLPQIPGLDGVDVLTNETLFKLRELPSRLLVLGAGAIGMEMAQAFRRLGSAVTVIDRGPPLAKEDEEAASLVAARLAVEGVAFRAPAKVTRAASTDDGVTLTLESGETVSGSHLLAAVGRFVDTGGLGLEAIGVEADETGIEVDARRRTTARGVYAIGDCRRGPRFTHAAGYEGARMVMEIGFGIPAAVGYAALPRVTFTEPELAQVGMTETEARKTGGRIEVFREAFSQNDRAVTESETDGFLKVVRRNGRVVGATIVGEGAGELTAPWVLAVSRSSASVWALSGAVLPYPTRSEISKAAAFTAFEHRIFGRSAKRWAGFLAGVRRRFPPGGSVAGK